MKAQDWLDLHYPKGSRHLITELVIEQKHLKVDKNPLCEEDKVIGELDLSDFVNLKKLRCCCFVRNWWNETIQDIVIKDLSKNTELEEILLADTNYDCDIGMFSHLTKLKDLVVNNKRWYGSLKSLENCKELRYLDVSNSRIEGGLEYLPSNHFIGTGFIDRHPSAITDRHRGKEPRIQFVCVNTPFKMLLKHFDYDVEAWQMVNHPELLNIDFDTLMDKLDQKISEIEEFMDNMDTHSTASSSIRGRRIVISCGRYQEVLARLKIKYRTLNQDRTKKHKQKIGELRREVEQTKQEKKEADEVHGEAMRAMDNWYRRLVNVPQREDKLTQTERCLEETPSQRNKDTVIDLLQKLEVKK